MNKIDFTKPVQTIDGQPVEIITTKGRDKKYPVIGYIGNSSTFHGFTLHGEYIEDEENKLNLMNVPEKKTMYLNVYESGNSMVTHGTRDKADEHASVGRIACVKVEYTEGQFDE